MPRGQGWAWGSMKDKASLTNLALKHPEQGAGWGPAGDILGIQCPGGHTRVASTVAPARGLQTSCPCLGLNLFYLPSPSLPGLHLQAVSLLPLQLVLLEDSMWHSPASSFPQN